MYTSTLQQNFSLTIHQKFGYTRQHMRILATQDSTHDIDIGLHAAQAHEPKYQRTGFAMPQTLTRDLQKKIHRTTSRLRALERYIYTHTSIHVYAHLYSIHIHIYIYTYMHVYIYTARHDVYELYQRKQCTCMYVCVCVCVCTYVYIHMCVCVYIYIRKHLHRTSRRLRSLPKHFCFCIFFLYFIVLPFVFTITCFYLYPSHKTTTYDLFCVTFPFLTLLVHLSF